jgi:choline dehydrogenase
LASTDPHDHPQMELNFLATDEDRRRMRAGVRFAWEVAQHPAIRSLTEEVLAPVRGTIDDDATLNGYLFERVKTDFHPVGTARMGPAGDPMAVVDDHCRVRGDQDAGDARIAVSNQGRWSGRGEGSPG